MLGGFPQSVQANVVVLSNRLCLRFFTAFTECSMLVSEIDCRCGEEKHTDQLHPRVLRWRDLWSDLGFAPFICKEKGTTVATGVVNTYTHG